MQVNAMEWRNNTSDVALPSLHPAAKNSECEEEGKWYREVPSIQIQKKVADVFFCLSYNSFTIICSHANLFSFPFDKTKL